MQNEQTTTAAPTASRTGLQIYLLGPLRIERAGEVIHLPRRKVEALLAYLLLHPEPQTRDHLATLFWGDSSDAQARHSLRTALATVRKEAAADLLLADRDQVQLNPAFPCWVDLHELLNVTNALDHVPLEQLRAKLALWQGELLAGFYDDWITLEREHYRERLLALFLQVIQALRARSEYPPALEVAQKVLALDPANEQAHQHVMFCYMAAGDRAAALHQYELCARALHTELDAPPLPETTALYQWIKQNSGETTAAAAKITNLPIPLTSFVGRTQQMTAVKRLLDPTATATRLLTLSGAGGSGKTRLAIQVATDLIDRFAHGVWWVELAAVTEAEQVARAVAKTLGVVEQAHEACVQSIGAFLVDKQLLLVLDNCEHLIDACAQLATTLLSRCPRLQLLTTSREPLNIGGETIWQVPTLALPAPQAILLDELLLQFECIRLFAERATAVQPSFRLTLANAAAVIEICRQLDGIPLAIELAAARVKVLPVEQIAAYLQSAIGARFALLTQGSRTALPRQQTLRAAIDWSYDLLDEAEKWLFRQLAVFRGGFTLAALEQFLALGLRQPGAGLGDAPAKAALSPSPTPLDLLTQLVDKSLVIVEPQDGQNRYRLLETLREYAQAQFPDAAALQSAQRRHAAFFLDWAEQAAPNLTGLQQQVWLNRFEAEHPNLRAALDALLTGGETERALRLGVALFRFWGTRGYVSEGRAWFQKMFQMNESPTAEPLAKALNVAGFLAFRQGDLDQALAFYQESLARFQQSEDEIGMVDVLQNLALLGIPQGKFALAQDYLEQSLALSRQLAYPYGLARALQHLGNLAYDQDKIADARDYFLESLTQYRSLGNQVSIANLLLNVGNAFTVLGEATTAHAYHQECLSISRAIEHNGLIGTVLRSLGLYALAQNEFEQARTYAQESLQIMRTLGDKSNTSFALLLLGEVAHKQGEHKPAFAYYCQHLASMVELNYKWPIYDVLENMARLLIDMAQHPQLASLFLSAAAAVRQEVGTSVPAAEQPAYTLRLNSLRQRLGDTTFEQIWQQGNITPLDQIVTEAMRLTR